MNKKNKTVIPKLRLCQFKDKPEWDICKFGRLIVPVEERAGSNKYTLMSVTSGAGLVSQVEKFGREIAGSAYKNYYVIKKNDFAYNKSATKLFPEGYISMLTEYEEAALPNSIFTCFRIVDKECDPRFFDQLFHNNYHGTWLRKYIEVGARAHGSLSVDTKHLWNMPVALPKLEEQQKIADCLSSLDDLIAAEDKKLSALKDHKKGLMQKLFPAEGKTVPEWRFPEFRNSNEWKKNLINDFAKVTTGNKDTQNKIDNGKYPFFVRSQTVEYIDTYTLDCEAILTSGDGVGVGKNFHYIIGKFDFHQRVYCIYDFQKEIYGKFIYYYFSEHFQKRVMQLSAKNSVDSVRRSMITDMPMYIPKFTEQQKIADFLSSVDELIAAQAEKIEALKEHKKGLLQGLFPSIVEVSQ